MKMHRGKIGIVFAVLSLGWCLKAKSIEYTLIQSNNIQRQELLQQKCDKYHFNDSNELSENTTIHSLTEIDMEHLLIDRDHKLLYCYVPKVISFQFFNFNYYSRIL
jgi:hypothetical protein